MLRKMMLQGLAAAVLIGAAAAVYAQAQSNGYLPAPAATRGETTAAPASAGTRDEGERGRRAIDRDGTRPRGHHGPGDDD